MWRRSLSLFVCLILGVMLFSLPAYAWTPEEAETDFFEALPPLVREEFPKEDFPTADDFGIDYYLTYIVRLATGEGNDFFSTLFSILFIVLVSALATRLSGKSAPAVELLLTAVTAMLLYGLSSEVFSAVGSYLSDTATFGEALLPVFTALYAAGGNAAAAVSSGASFTLFLSALTVLSDRFLFPLIRILFVFSLVGEIKGGVDLSGFSATLRKTYTTVLSFTGVLFSFVMSAQGLLSASADNLTARSAKFAVQQMIPIVGGTVSGALGTVAASVSYFRTAIGGAAVVAILILTLPVLLRVFLSRLAFSVGRSAARLVGASTAERVLSDFCGIYDMLLASVTLAAVAFILISAAFAKCAAAVG